MSGNGVVQGSNRSVLSGVSQLIVIDCDNQGSNGCIVGGLTILQIGDFRSLHGVSHVNGTDVVQQVSVVEGQKGVIADDFLFNGGSVSSDFGVNATD